MLRLQILQYRCGVAEGSGVQLLGSFAWGTFQQVCALHRNASPVCARPRGACPVIRTGLLQPSAASHGSQCGVWPSPWSAEVDGHVFNLVSAHCLGVLPLMKPALNLCAVPTPATYASCFWPQLLRWITNAVASFLL